MNWSVAGRDDGNHFLDGRAGSENKGVWPHVRWVLFTFSFFFFFTNFTKYFSRKGALRTSPLICRGSFERQSACDCCAGWRPLFPLPLLLTWFFFHYYLRHLLDEIALDRDNSLRLRSDYLLSNFFFVFFLNKSPPHPPKKKKMNLSFLTFPPKKTRRRFFIFF